jgi:cellulose synthase/poly-beta-1,6-N-acetylglucosamine synthase-like glycosyltransferase
MKEPWVTVLVTVKNSKKTIEKCIKSLLSLRYKNYKIFVTDAFSTDGTYEILEKFRKKYPKKILLERIKGNIAKAHNYMIKKVKTPFIAMTDADCVVDKNWLKNLIFGFTSSDIIATAGYCSTPKEVNYLQKLIGLELEHRFQNFPEFISRAPTMNLCVRTKYAKQVKFDEKLEVAQETDWGYRLTKLGKMRYVPKAIVWHYHRPTLKSYFIQQLKYGKFVPLIYSRHKEKMFGDHISTPSMFLQLLLFDLTMVFFFFSLFFKVLLLPSILLLIFLITSFLFDIFQFAKSLKNALGLLFLYFLRALAWTIGILFGLKYLFS